MAFYGFRGVRVDGGGFLEVQTYHQVIAKLNPSEIVVRNQHVVHGCAIVEGTRPYVRPERSSGSFDHLLQKGILRGVRKR